MNTTSSPTGHRRRTELLRLASRTFAVGIERLPASLREPVQTAYLLLRVSDYLEDSEGLAPTHKVDLLTAWAAVLDGRERPDAFSRLLGPVEETTPDASVAREFDLVLEALDALPDPHGRIVRRHVLDTTRGMARWLRRGPDFAVEADLDDYMHEVAGRVGWLLTELFVEEAPSLKRGLDRWKEQGRSFGLGLQTVNVIRGLHQDHERGWLYVPREYLQDAQIEGPDLFDGRHGPAALQVLGRLTRKAERHLADAVEYTVRLPRGLHGVRVFCALPLLFAVRTVALSRANPQVFHDEVKLSRSEVLALVARTRWMAWSNRWIRGVSRRLGEN